MHTRIRHYDELTFKSEHYLDFTAGHRSNLVVPDTDGLVWLKVPQCQHFIFFFLTSKDSLYDLLCCETEQHVADSIFYLKFLFFLMESGTQEVYYRNLKITV